MKILFVQLKRIGDLILTTPVIRAVREAIPNARIGLVNDASCRSLLPALDVDEHLVFDRHEPLKLLRALPRFRADYCFDLTGTDRSAFLSVLSRSARRVTFERFRKKFLRSLIYSDFVDSSVRDRHTADHYTDLLAPTGIRADNVPLDLRIPAPPAITPAAPYAVIHAGTARPEKYWLAERWALIAAHLQSAHALPVVLTGSPEASEQSHLAEIKNLCPSPPLDLSGQTDLLGLAAIIKGATIFCGVDTAAMHLADAARTPSVALFGPTNPFHWRPRHTQNIIVRADTSEPFTPAQKGGPMAHIPVETVTAAIDRVLTTVA